MQREIMRAKKKSQQVAYAELHGQLRMELGAPSEPSRGTGDCLALVLVSLRAGPDAGPSRPRHRQVGVGGLPCPGGDRTR